LLNLSAMFLRFKTTGRQLTAKQFYHQLIYLKPEAKKTPEEI
jgi:hypothetical protein